MNFEWEARDGTKYKGIFILPKQYAIVNRDQILNATKTVKALGVGSVEG